MWAPWRIEYVQSSSGNCIFCSKAKSNKDKENYVLQRREYCFSLLNIYPYNNGHTMIAPYRHTSSFMELEKKEMTEMMDLVQTVQKKLHKKFDCEGFNIGLNEGKVAGAGIEQHIHLHIVPRWEGDTNFISTVANTEIIPESLKSVYKKLKD